MRDKIQSQWTIYFLSLGSITIKESRIRGPRIGICANQINVNMSKIDSSSRGCEPDKGLGPGVKAQGCAGAGGAHGGQGGYGGSESDEERTKDKCLIKYPSPYYYGQEARYEGSGGASGDI